MHLHYKAEGGREQSLQNQMKAMQAPYEEVYYSAYDSLMKNQFENEDQKKSFLQTFNNYQDTSQAIYIEFGKRHPNSFLGLDILYRNRQRVGKNTIAYLLDQMTDSFKFSAKAQALKIFLEPLAKRGKPYIDFNAKFIDGSDFKLSSLKGNYILLSFWSAGCGPCRMENREISKNYSKIKNDISIVSFSIDPEKQLWVGASKSDNILWTNVSDLEGDLGKIKTQYDVQSIPTSFLINKEGVIVERFNGFTNDFLDQLNKLISNK